MDEYQASVQEAKVIPIDNTASKAEIIGNEQHPMEQRLPLSTNSNQTHGAESDGHKPEPSELRGRPDHKSAISHFLPRGISPSRDHDRESGSRYRHHYRKHRRSSSPSTSPPSMKRNRRRSDAESDHAFRGRARQRSRSPLSEEQDAAEPKHIRKRSLPPSRHRSESGVDEETGELRRQRSFPNIYRAVQKPPDQELTKV